MRESYSRYLFVPVGIRTEIFSTDGTKLVSAYVGVSLRNTKTGALLHSFKGHDGFANCVTVSPDGCRIASGGFDQTIRLWDVRTGKELQTINAHTDVECVAFSPDGSMFVAGGQIRKFAYLTRELAA